jgi:hypothetical protein
MLKVSLLDSKSTSQYALAPKKRVPITLLAKGTVHIFFLGDMV